MGHGVDFAPVRRQRLADALVERITGSIAAGTLRAGDRLPPILQMARTWRVAANTVREALVRLEAGRVVEIRHGAGVFVSPAAAGDPPVRRELL